MNRTAPSSCPSSLAWAAVALGLSVAGCTSPRELNEECVFNADCVEPLVCSARRCRAQCGSDRDCPRGEICAGSGQPGKKVCVAPQSARLCAYSSECASTSSCVNGICYSTCGADTDCPRPPPTNTCDVARRVCREPDLVTEGTPSEDGGAPTDASGDAGEAGVDVPGVDGSQVTDAPAADVVVTDGPGPDAPTMDAPQTDVTAVDVSTTDVSTMDVSTMDAPATDGPSVDAQPGDGPDASTLDVADAAAGDAAGDASRDAADVRDVLAVDVGDAAVLVDGGMVCVGTPDLQSDLDNCGRCGNRCPRPTAGTGTVACVAGVCRATCVTGYSDCNGLCTDHRVDRNHCGSCGNVCEVACNAGVCVNPVELVVGWSGATLVRLTDNTWRGFGYGNWSSEASATPPVFPWGGHREVPSPVPLELTGQNLHFAHPNRLYQITAGGTLQGLGSNGGALGDGMDASRTRWVDVPGITNVRDVTGCLNGIYSIGCAAYGTDGRVACWGSDGAYAYGNPGGTYRTRPDTMYPVLRADDQPLTGVTRLTRGTSFTLALRDNGEVWTWGYNGDGRLGLGYSAPTDYAAQARRIPTLPPCTAVAAGLEFGCALDNTGALWCWGRNDVGQVGDGTGMTRNVPTRVMTPDPSMPTRDIPLADVVAVATATSSACAITSSRALYCWGYNIVGQVGVDLSGNVLRATRVPAPAGVATLRVQSVALSDGFGCLMTVAESGATVIPPRIYCWGYEGNLGYPGSGRTRAPTRPVFW